MRSVVKVKRPSGDGRFTFTTDLKQSTSATFKIYTMGGVPVYDKTIAASNVVSVYPDISNQASGSYIAEKIVDGVRMHEIIIKQ